MRLLRPIASFDDADFAARGARVEIAGGRGTARGAASVDGDGIIIPDGVPGLRTWLDPAWSTDPTGSSPVPNGGAVGTYTDRGPAARIFTAAGGARPTFRTAGINGKPTLRYASASSQKMTAPISFDPFVDPFPSDAEQVILAVVAPTGCTSDSATSWSNVGILNDGDNQYTGLYLRSFGPRVIGYWYDNHDSHADVVIPAFPSGPMLLTMISHAGVLSLQLNDDAPVVYGSTVGTRTAVGTTLQLGHGAGGFFDGDMGDIMILGQYDAANVAGLKVFLRRKYWP